MSNIQFYWDGNVGAVEYDVRRTLFTTKPSVPDVSFDTIVYSEDDKVAKKILNDTLSDLTDAEIATIKLFANASAKSGVIVPSRSFLTVDNAGFVLAQRTAEYMYNTLANFMFTSGNSAELANEGIVTGKWTPEVVQFNS